MSKPIIDNHIVLVGLELAAVACDPNSTRERREKALDGLVGGCMVSVHSLGNREGLAVTRLSQIVLELKRQLDEARGVRDELARASHAVIRNHPCFEDPCGQPDCPVPLAVDALKKLEGEKSW